MAYAFGKNSGRDIGSGRMNLFCPTLLGRVIVPREFISHNSLHILR